MVTLCKCLSVMQVEQFLLVSFRSWDVTYLLPCIALLYLNIVNDQLDAQFPYFIMRLLESSTCFEQRRAHHQEVELY